PGEQHVLLATLSATPLDLAQLFPRGRDIALLQIGLAHIFANQRVVGIVPQRFLVVAEAYRDAAGLAVRIAEIVEDARIGLVGRQAEDRDRLAVAAFMGERPAIGVEAVVIDGSAGGVLAGLGLLVENLALRACRRAVAAPAASTGRECRGGK